MIENVKKISNPLTVIAIFAALAEVSATAAFSFSNLELQKTFIWFVMLFPTLLVVLFFITWNFNPKVMYAPSDFKDEKNFISTLSGFTADIQQISITQDNIGDYHENLEKFGSDVKNKLDDIIPSREILDFANNLFDIFMKKIQINFKNKNINSVSYGIQSSNYFLLSVSFPPELSHNNTAVTTNFIIHFRNEYNKVFLEIIGKGISGYDKDIIVENLLVYINNQIDSMKKFKEKYIE